VNRRPHVLVARQDSLGDVLLAGPAVRAVAAGAGRVTLLCGPRGQAAAELLPGVDDILVWEAAWIDADPGPVRREAVDRFVDQLTRRRIDQAMVLTSFHQSPLPLALLLRMAKVNTIGAICEDYPGSLLDVRHRIDDAADLHEVERALSLAAAMGYRLPRGDNGHLAIRGLEIPTLGGPPEVSLSRRAGGVLALSTGSELRCFDATWERRYVVVHPGASVPARAWATERHAALVEALAGRGWTVVVTGAAGEQELTARVAGGPDPRDGVTDLGGRVDLAGLAEVLAGAAAVVAGNTGPAHLAAAVRTPVVSLFAPTVPAARWRPWGVPHVLLGDQEAACAGSRARVCPVVGHPCLNQVGVEEVLAALDRLLAATGTGEAAAGAAPESQGVACR
jgi:ADP-heptose:LPS heptosyltransferase